jgi:hypothetical protein
MRAHARELFMKTLTYPDVFTLIDAEVIGIDLDDRVFVGKDTQQGIVETDHAMKDRCLRDNYIEARPDFATTRSMKLHSVIRPSLYHTIRGQYVCRKGEIEKIQLLESVTCADKNIWALIELSDEMVAAGFSLIGQNLINIKDRPLKEILITNTDHSTSKVPNDHHVVNLYLVTMN